MSGPVTVLQHTHRLLLDCCKGRQMAVSQTNSMIFVRYSASIAARKIFCFLYIAVLTRDLNIRLLTEGCILIVAT